MKVSLLTDAPKHNLALMKLSMWHIHRGDQVLLNSPLFPADKTYASVLFEENLKAFRADEYGGPAYVGRSGNLPEEVEIITPDYSLFGMDYSLGYTYRPCHRACDFCKVTQMEHPDTEHHSIWEFHNKYFDTICIMNNNTFMDPRWKETFEEVWDANLIVRDENGYDLRLLDDEKADALHRTRFHKDALHFAWDRMEDEAKIVNGLKLLTKHHLRGNSHQVYVLIGYDTTEEEDLHRCQVIHDHGLTPYPMPYVKNDYTRRFKRFMNLHYYREHATIESAWKDYKG